MNKDNVLNELVKLNSNVADIAYAGEHIWHSGKAEYAELIYCPIFAAGLFNSCVFKVYNQRGRGVQFQRSHCSIMVGIFTHRRCP